MRWSRVFVVTGVLAMLAVPFASAEEGRPGGPVPGDEAKRQGIRSYRVEMEENGLLRSIDLLDAQARSLGVAKARTTVQGVTVDLEPAVGRRVGLDWDFLKQEVVFRDEDLGKRWTFWLDTRKGSWRGQDSAAVTREYQAEIGLLAGVLKDFALVGGRSHSLRLSRPGEHESGKPWEKRAGTKDIFDDSCSGDMKRGAGELSATKSGCCEAATDNVNYACINRWCWGCCRLLDCDAFCALGDYICACGRSGQACSGDDFPPLPPPPPPPSGGGGGGGSVGGGGCTCDCDGDGWVTPIECTSGCGGVVNGGYCDIF